MDRAKAAIQQQMDVLNGKYDKLTDHGKSGTTAAGEAGAKAEQAKAPPAGQVPVKPDDSKQHSRVQDPGWKYFYDANDRLILPNHGRINSALFSNDPIINRGYFVVDTMVHVGLQQTGGVLLSDTRMQIVDSVSGDTLLDGFLYQIAYIPSTLPGYAGMIQAYLDIPPASVGGIRNTIGSPFLNGMQAASDTGQATEVWFYAAAPLFDSNGASVIPPGGVQVTAVMGVAQSLPVPAISRRGLAALAILLAGAATLAIWRRSTIRRSQS
jgi:hypothetical protein